MTDAERLADAILKAAGSGLHNYTMPATRNAIISAAQTAVEAAALAGYRAGMQRAAALVISPGNAALILSEIPEGRA